MTATLHVTEDDVRAALGTVVDPELDEPITDLGFVRSVTVGAGAVEVHLRLPTSFCAPNFAWLMVSDARDAVAAVPGAGRGGGGGGAPPPGRGVGPPGGGGAAAARAPGRVVVELDDHHDSDLINRGLAADAGYRGTFGHEAEDSLDELRATFQRKAHTAAMERVLTGWLRADPGRAESTVGELTLGDLPPGPATDALVARRAALGLPVDPASPVLLAPDGSRPGADAVTATLRRARSVRISVDGNAHFCRGLLTTRYPGAEADQVPRPDPAHPLLPLEVVS